MPTLSELQQHFPWDGRFSKEYIASKVPYKDFQHALLHVVKAGGKLSAIIDDADHRVTHDFDRGAVRKYLADLVICALQMAAVAPGIPINLEEGVVERLREKLNVKIEA